MAADTTQNTLVHFKQGGALLEVASGGAIVIDSGGSITINGTVATPLAGAFVGTSPTVGFGYGTGAGGSVTQTTTRATSVTLNTVCGQIVTDTTSLTAGVQTTFKVSNSAVAATDVVVVSVASASSTGFTVPSVRGTAAGAFTVGLANLHASTADTVAMTINFAVVKGVTS